MFENEKQKKQKELYSKIKDILTFLESKNKSFVNDELRNNYVTELENIFGKLFLKNAEWLYQHLCLKLQELRAIEKIVISDQQRDLTIEQIDLYLKSVFQIGKQRKIKKLLEANIIKENRLAISEIEKDSKVVIKNFN